MKLTKVELTVDFLIVDNVKPVLHLRYHVGNFKVKPLVMVVGVDVWTQY